MNSSKLLPFFLLLTCLACDRKSNRDGMEIKVTCPECVGKEIGIYHTTMLRLEEKKLYEAPFDSSGTAVIKIPNQDTLSVNLRVKDTDSTFVVNTRIYLEPNTHIAVSFEKDSLTFAGDLKKINDYLAELKIIDKKRNDYRDVWSTENLRLKTTEELNSYLAVIKKFGADFEKKIAADQSLSAYERNLLSNAHTSFAAYQQSDFDSDRLLEQRMPYYENENDDDKRAIKHLDSLTRIYFTNLTINPFLLILNGANYGASLDISNRQQDIGNVHYELLKEDSISLYNYMKQTIALNRQPNSYQDFIMAYCIASNSLLSQSTYDELNTIISNFKQDYPKSKYIPELEVILADYATLKPGAPLKDFSMYDTQGKSFKLSDLKGKLIYIDIWATWCGPCVEEFPYSKKLSARYANNKDLIFLYLSVDGSQEKWKAFLNKNPTLKGVHANQTQSDNFRSKPNPNDVMELYKVNGIPHYILIGKDGRMISSNASRPSSLVHGNYLDSLLRL